MSESTQTKLLSSVPAISSLAKGDKITVVTASGQTALVSLSTLLGAVKVGGRNLARNSNVHKEGTYGIGNYKLTKPWEAGHSYICTIWGTIGEGKTDVFSIWDARGKRYLFSATKVAEGIYRGVFNGFTYPDYDVEGIREQLNIHVMPSSVQVLCTIDLFKIEEGNVSTDWTPAPEDLNWGGGNFLILRSKQGKRPNFKGRRAAA